MVVWEVWLGELYNQRFPSIQGKGGKNRRRGKNENESDKRELIFKEDGQEYAQVVKMLGNGRLEANCFDGVSRLCHIRGKLRKKASPVHTHCISLALTKRCSHQWRYQRRCMSQFTQFTLS